MTDTTKHIAAIRAQLANLAGIKSAAMQSESAIQTAAEKRLEAVDANLKALKPRVFLDDGAAKQYEGLTLERGRLQRILSGEKA